MYVCLWGCGRGDVELLIIQKPSDRRVSPAHGAAAFSHPDKTRIAMRNFQWYLGPAGSGAPLHFHRSGRPLNRTWWH